MSRGAMRVIRKLMAQGLSIRQIATRFRIPPAKIDLELWRHLGDRN